jgi:PUA-domain protein
MMQMTTKQRRYPMKTKEAKQVIEEASKNLKLNLDNLFGTKTIVEVIESDVGEIYLIEGKPLLFKADEKVLPTLLFTEFTSKAPRIVVDMGAIPYVCKGATVMAPGVVGFEGEFSRGDLVLVVDMKHGKALAVGESLMDAATSRNTKKGPIVKTLHYVSDKVWDFIKAMIE